MLLAMEGIDAARKGAGGQAASDQRGVVRAGQLVGDRFNSADAMEEIAKTALNGH